MGKKGSKLSAEATARAEELVSELSFLGDVSSRKMFGGHGIFCDGVMFAIVDSEATAYLRVDEELRGEREAAGSKPHGKMPYMSVSVDHAELPALAERALEAARAAKK